MKTNGTIQISVSPMVFSRIIPIGTQIAYRHISSVVDPLNHSAICVGTPPPLAQLDVELSSVFFLSSGD